MAKLNNINLSILVAVFSSMVAVASMLGSAAAAAEVEAPSPAPETINIAIPPEPEPGFYQFLNECAKKITPDCGDTVVRSIVEDVGVPSKKCCVELVYELGRACHDDMLMFFLSLPELELNATDVYAKSEKVWGQCVEIGGNVSKLGE